MRTKQWALRQGARVVRLRHDVKFNVDVEGQLFLTLCGGSLIRGSHGIRHQQRREGRRRRRRGSLGVG